MAVVVVATIRPLPGRKDEIVAAFEPIIARVHAEDEGCELYALHEGDDRVVMIEKWASEELLAQHSAGPALAELVAKTGSLTDGPPDIQVLRPHPAGTPAQGTL